jgi:hypothetical protein
MQYLLLLFVLNYIDLTHVPSKIQDMSENGFIR